MSQLKEVPYTEREQIFMYITTKIKLQRHNIDAVDAQKQIDRMERLLEAEYSQSEDHVNQNREQITEMENQLAAMRNASNSKTREYKDLMDKAQGMMKDLKVTRDQRIKRAEDSKHNISGLLKWLDEEENRRAVGVEMMLHDAAAEVERARLTELHTYQDKAVDQPILGPEE